MYTWCICLCAVYAVSCVIQNMKITQVSRRNMQNKVLCMGITLPKGVRTKGLTAQSANSPHKQGGSLSQNQKPHIQIPDHFPVHIKRPFWGIPRFEAKLGGSKTTQSVDGPMGVCCLQLSGAHRNPNQMSNGGFHSHGDILHYPSVN